MMPCASPIVAMCLLIAGSAVAFAREGLDNLPAAQIVVIGEVHDNPIHHQTQARLVAELAPKAIVFEMLSPAQVKAADGVDRRDAAAMAKALSWQDSGWPDFALYAPIFAASGTARIYGAALPRAEVRGSMTEGAAAIFGADAARFGLTDALPAAEQSAREADQMAAHCDALPVEMLHGMVNAQRLRDASFARTALQALDDTGGVVVVITGSGHADRARGIPAALAMAAPKVSVLSIGQLESNPGADAPFDRWLVTAPMKRDDSCAAFAKSKQ